MNLPTTEEQTSLFYEIGFNWMD